MKYIFINIFENFSHAELADRFHFKSYLSNDHTFLQTQLTQEINTQNFKTTS